MQRNEAEILAYGAAQHLFGDDTLRDRFLSLTGLTGDDIRTNISDQHFLAGLLSFFVRHEPDLIALAEALDEKPDTIVRAWHRLDGDNAHE